jgi:hypothetical protein
MTRRHWVGVAVLVVLALLLVTALAADRLKQALLPDYAKPARIEALFHDQITALEDVATKRKQEEEVVPLLAAPSIHGALVVNSYDRALPPTIVKPRSSGLERAQKAGIWFRARPSPGRPVVNLWGGRFAVFGKAFYLPNGKVMGIELAVDLAYLRDARR